MSARRLGLSVAAAVAVMAAGVVVVDLTTRNDGTGSARSSTGPPADPAAGAPIALPIVEFAFPPTPLSVRVGQPVEAVNEDTAPHTVSSGSRGALDGRFDVRLAGNARSTFVVDQAGTYPYICTIHPGMQGTLEVTP